MSNRDLPPDRCGGDGTYLYLDESPALPWKCFTCGSGYAEYVNGCPHCWNAGIRSGVTLAKSEPNVGMVKDE
jgi:hypothetical protein